LPPGQFVEVYLNVPLEVCEQRDTKGLYAKARAGKIREFTGVSAPYEAPATPEIELATAQLSVGDCVSKIAEFLAGLDRQHIEPGPDVSRSPVQTK
jgi:adenylylsulfate kinase-like enzyme